MPETPIVKFDATVLYTDAYQLIVEGWNELVQEGMTPEMSAGDLFSDDCACLSLRSEGETLAVLVFLRESKMTFLVVLGYVEPSSRRMGCYTKLWEALLVRAKNEGVRRIIGCTHPENHVMQAVMRKLNRHVVQLTYETLL